MAVWVPRASKGYRGARQPTQLRFVEILDVGEAVGIIEHRADGADEHLVETMQRCARLRWSGIRAKASQKRCSRFKLALERTIRGGGLAPVNHFTLHFMMI